MPNILDSAKDHATKLALDDVAKAADKEVLFEVDQQHVEIGADIEKGRLGLTAFVRKQFDGAKEFAAGVRGRFKIGK